METEFTSKLRAAIEVAPESMKSTLETLLLLVLGQRRDDATPDANQVGDD